MSFFTIRGQIIEEQRGYGRHLAPEILRIDKDVLDNLLFLNKHKSPV